MKRKFLNNVCESFVTICLLLSLLCPVNPGYAGTSTLYESNTPVFISSNQTITTSGVITLSHGLPVRPTSVLFNLVCQTADAGYSVGDVISGIYTNHALNGNSKGPAVALVANSTSITVAYCNQNSVFSAVPKSGGNPVNLTNSKWRLQVIAWILTPS